MPSFAPRVHPIKKKEELSKREFEFTHAILKKLSIQKIAKAAEKYRKAQLSLLKARIHVAKEEAYRKRSEKLNIDIFQKDIDLWKNKTTEEIVKDFKVFHKLDELGI